MANQTMKEGIQVLKDNGVARIHFAHAKQNAFPATHLKGLHAAFEKISNDADVQVCLLYTSPSPRDGLLSRMPSSA